MPHRLPKLLQVKKGYQLWIVNDRWEIRDRSDNILICCESYFVADAAFQAFIDFTTVPTNSLQLADTSHEGEYPRPS